MADMFGAPVGMEHAIQSEHMLAETAMAPAKQRLFEANASLKEDEAAAQKRFAATAIDPKAGMWGIAAAAVNAGLPNAYKIANTASQIDARRIQGDLRQLRGQEIEVVTRGKLADEKARLLTGVTDDASLRAAMQDFERTTGRPSGLLGRDGELLVPYSPELVGRERALAISSKDAIFQEYRDRALASADQERVSKQRNRDFWQSMENQFEREAARQRARADQHGAAGFLPNSSQISAGADFLAEKFGVDSKEPWAKVLGRELIENAKRMHSGNPAISAKEALEQSFREMDKRGSFSGKSLLDKKEDKFRPKGLPYTDGKPDKDKLIAGQLYRDEAGTVREWTGKGWTTPTKPIRGTGAAPYQLSDRDAARALGLGGDEGNDSEPDDDEDD